jgi:predicted O-linked N-acetylglucosamine transferase (SPINDLY family)
MEVCEVWARILERVPNSHMLLKDRNFHDETIREYASHRFTQWGIPAERIILQPWESPPKHLSVYNLIDIGLDTFPYNGLTTTCEALWMGVPVVTLRGTAYASGAGVSLLSNIGLTEFIAGTRDEYIEIAVDLASHIEKLEYLRGSLRELVANSPLTDAKTFTADLEICYREMWKDWCNSLQK